MMICFFLMTFGYTFLHNNLQISLRLVNPEPGQIPQICFAMCTFGVLRDLTKAGTHIIFTHWLLWYTVQYDKECMGSTWLLVRPAPSGGRLEESSKEMTAKTLSQMIWKMVSQNWKKILSMYVVTKELHLYQYKQAFSCRLFHRLLARKYRHVKKFLNMF